MIDDKNKKIDFETIRIITKEYSYDKPKVTLNPEICKIETKLYKLNHFTENVSKSDSTPMTGEPYWKVVVTNTLTKSYDRWDEIDANNNIINKGQEFNINTDCKISNGDRVKECYIF